MRRLDFISVAPHLSIFKSGANKTNLGGFLFFIYIIILILLAVVYLYDYINKDNYSYDYTYVRNDTSLSEEKEVEKIMNDDFDFKFFLEIGDDDKYRPLYDNENFLIIDIQKLNEKLYSKKEGLDPKDNFTVINSSNTSMDDCIIKQYDTISKKIDELNLGVFYRCHGPNGTDCDIKDDDKIKTRPYRLNFGYRGYYLDHQTTTGKPINLLPENTYFQDYFEFLENTNIIYLTWNLIKYEETKGVFSKTFQDMSGNKNTFWGGDMDSVQTYTDDGHMKEMPTNYWKIKDQDGNHFIMLLYLENYFKYDYDKYTRTAKSLLDVLSNFCALSSTILSLMSLSLFLSSIISSGRLSFLSY